MKLDPLKKSKPLNPNIRALLLGFVFLVAGIVGFEITSQNKQEEKEILEERLNRVYATVCPNCDRVLGFSTASGGPTIKACPRCGKEFDFVSSLRLPRRLETDTNLCRTDSGL